MSETHSPPPSSEVRWSECLSALAGGLILAFNGFVLGALLCVALTAACLPGGVALAGGGDGLEVIVWVCLVVGGGGGAILGGALGLMLGVVVWRLAFPRKFPQELPDAGQLA